MYGVLLGMWYFAPGSKIAFGASYRRRDALVFQAEIPPGLVVVFRLDLAGEDFPAPLIDHKPEGKEGDLVERLAAAESGYRPRREEAHRAGRSA
jgi:hypothetical protein